MKTNYLFMQERNKGIRHFLRWATLNGLGFSFLGDTPIYLMAIHFGASNYELSYVDKENTLAVLYFTYQILK